jgi:hypothetical protein
VKASPRSYWDLLDRPPNGSQPFSIQGPWNIHDPVHETMTRMALRDAGVVPDGDDPAAWEYVRGVIWNDDPEALLFHDEADRTDHYSTGLEWVIRFKMAERRVAGGIRQGPGCPLTARSHFGDLQFFHGMASDDGVPAGETRDAILGWAELAYRVAIGEISPAAPLDAAGLKGAGALVARTAPNAHELFRCAGPADAPKRAAGALLHTVQDSFAAGHVQRTGPAREIQSFHSYAHQDHDRHAKDDGWRGGNSDADKVVRVAGGPEAVDRCTSLLQLLSRRAPWEQARRFLESSVFNLSRDASASGPGSAYT